MKTPQTPQTPQTPKALKTPEPPASTALGQDAAKAEADKTQSTQPPAEATLADVLAPLGTPRDNRPSMLADRPPRDASTFQK